jgi:hypothetical protein
MHELAMLQSSVDAFLQNAAASCPDVTCETEISDPEEPLSGCLLVRLRCYSRADSSSSSSSGRALDSRELQAWQDMVSVAVALMDAGCGRGAVGSEGVEGSGVPRLNVVYLNSSLSTQLAISRRRTTSKLLRRSAKVRGGAVMWIRMRTCWAGLFVGLAVAVCVTGRGPDGCGRACHVSIRQLLPPKHMYTAQLLTNPSHLLPTSPVLPDHILTASVPRPAASQTVMFVSNL